MGKIYFQFAGAQLYLFNFNEKDGGQLLSPRVGEGDVSSSVTVPSGRQQIFPADVLIVPTQFDLAIQDDRGETEKRPVTFVVFWPVQTV